MVTVRYFAGIAEAAGREEEPFEAASVGELRTAVLAAHPEPDFALALDACSILLDGEFVDEPARALPANAQVDILPPFAGG